VRRFSGFSRRVSVIKDNSAEVNEVVSRLYKMEALGLIAIISNALKYTAQGMCVLTAPMNIAISPVRLTEFLVMP
jgi:hypothetical protein